MAGAKESSRQKMIGMMYLVLTALLAMNVSKEILNSFVVINESLYKSNEIFKDKNDMLLNDFKIAKEKDPGKFTPFLALAEQVNKGADELNKHIEELKKHLIMKTDDKEASAADTLIQHMAGVDAKDNYDIPTDIMIGSEPSQPKNASVEWSAMQLRKKIENFRDSLITSLDSKDAMGKNIFTKTTQERLKNKITKALQLHGGIENGVKAEWEIINFYSLPLAAVITNLSKIQTDINNVQADVIGTLYTEVKKTEASFDNLNAKIFAPTNYVLFGDDYQADIMLVASSSTKNPKIYLGDIDTTIKDIFKNPLIGNGTELTDIAGGAGQYLKKADKEGMQNWSGVIEFEAEEGKKYFPFSSSYMVAKPAASVSPDNMNVLYIGLDNPITITAAGVAPENLSPSISGTGTTLTGSRGKYTVRVTGGANANIAVNAKFNGVNKNMGNFNFRVKRIPKPMTDFNGMTGTFTMKKSLIEQGQGIKAYLENFYFNVPFTIKSFNVTISSRGVYAEAKNTDPGGRFTQEQKNLLKQARKGTKINIDGVRCGFPDGRTETIPGVTIIVD